VGGPEYVEALQRQLGIKAKGREILPVEGGCQLRETETLYQGLLDREKSSLSPENTFLGNQSLPVAMA
jgi:hypothetical protein